MDLGEIDGLSPSIWSARTTGLCSGFLWITFSFHDLTFLCRKLCLESPGDGFKDVNITTL